MTETSYFSKNPASAFSLACLRGFIQGVFYQEAKKYLKISDIKILNVAPSEAKATLGIKRLKREESKKEVRRVLELVNKSYSELSEDELDAIAISYAGFNKL